MEKIAGLGFRKDFAEAFLDSSALSPAFVEVAPENWMHIGGYWKKILGRVAERYPLSLHGLSLSVGSPDELDIAFLKEVRNFMREWNISFYSEHISYAKCDNAHLYDLLPIPFRWDAVKHVAARISQVQDILEMPVAMEIVSYYTPVAAEMTENEFINALVKESGCNLLLDVNNVYVNAFNHRYDAKQFIDNLPLDKVTYIHMAGHEQVAPDLIIDTHGEAIIDPVYDLYAYTMNKLKRPVSTLLERDFNIPEMQELQDELNRINHIANEVLSHDHAAVN